MKKLIALLICIAMMASVVGCRSSDPQEEAGSSNDASADEENSGLTTLPGDLDIEDYTYSNDYGIDFEAAFAIFEPDTLMLTIGEYEVRWAEMYFYLRSNANMILLNFGGAVEWSEMFYDDTTIADFVQSYALENAQMYKSFEHGGNIMGISLNSEDLDSIQMEFDMLSMTYGGEDEFLKILWEQDGCYSRELFDYLIGISFLANRIFLEYYGEDGELLSDEAAAEIVENEGYLMAKHILILRDEEDEENAALSEAEFILAQLESYIGSEFDWVFDEMMYSFSEDAGGMMSYPEGYLFQYGDMVNEFYEACVALEVGEISGIVETNYGYHIIYRLPINYDIIPYSNAMYGDYRTLRVYAAAIHFDEVLFEWRDSLPVVQSAEYESIDIATLFAFSNS